MNFNELERAVVYVVVVVSHSHIELVVAQLLRLALVNKNRVLIRIGESYEGSYAILLKLAQNKACVLLLMKSESSGRALDLLRSPSASQINICTPTTSASLFTP